MRPDESPALFPEAGSFASSVADMLAINRAGEPKESILMVPQGFKEEPRSHLSLYESEAKPSLVPAFPVRRGSGRSAGRLGGGGRG